MKIKIIGIIVILFLFAFKNSNKKLPQGFVYADEIIPNLKLDLRYLTSNNFVGTPIDGYKTNKCILTIQATKALKKVQEELEENGFCLKIYDAYRPQKA